jgi:hypothetical protein
MRARARRVRGVADTAGTPAKMSAGRPMNERHRHGVQRATDESREEEKQAHDRKVMFTMGRI